MYDPVRGIRVVPTHPPGTAGKCLGVADTSTGLPPSTAGRGPVAAPRERRSPIR